MNKDFVLLSQIHVQKMNTETGNCTTLQAHLQ